MSRISTGGRRGVAAASLLGLLATAAACGTQDETALDLGGAVRDQTSAGPEGRSQRSLEADALRAAQGQLPPAPEQHGHPGPRVPDSLP
jgi:hypothetical protein